ncbi:MAG: hypothetical protein QNJ40_17160 [Xanthomonadales bacterium]|nr:hypothetical protein [Xanthomonadales bacterium]
MTQATANDVQRIFPGIQDHVVIEVLDTSATVEDLEAARMLMQDEDSGLRAFKHQEGERLNALMKVLDQAGIVPEDERSQ